MKNKIINGALGLLAFALVAVTVALLGAPSRLAAADTVRTAPPLLISTESRVSKVLTNTVNMTNTLDCAGGSNVAFQLNVIATGDCTSNVLVDVYYSVDGSIFELWKSFGVAATSATRTHVITNYAINAVQKVKVVLSTTAITSAPLTNTTLYGAVK